MLEAAGQSGGGIPMKAVLEIRDEFVKRNEEQE
jgi:hypothetical protein